MAATLMACLAYLPAGAEEPRGSDAQIASTLRLLDETEQRGVVDFGYGVGVRRAPVSHKRTPRTAMAAFAAPVAPGAVPNGDAAASVNGFYAPVSPWPIIPIHMVLTPDGRVMNYGSGADGSQGGLLIYDVWDPKSGSGTAAHLVLPNGTASDIFCSAQSLVGTTGQVLVTGGDMVINGKRNNANSSVELYDPASNALTTTVAMHYQRWYPSLTPLPNGDKLLLGGFHQTINAAGQVIHQATTIPEIFNAATGWRTLPGATSDMSWFYPHTFAATGGLAFTIDPSGHIYRIDLSGTGRTTKLAMTAPSGSTQLPTIMFAPGKLLAVRSQGIAVVIDINGALPVVTPTASLSQERLWASATLLADGKVMVSGGSAVSNALLGVAYRNETWDPATGVWTLGATYTKPRLYHSNTLLLPDGSVVNGGGGAPGPVKNLNAEMFYPAYLYANDGSGNPAPRPTLSTATLSLPVGGSIAGVVGGLDQITRVTLLRTGSATHSTNLEQRFLDLPFTQNGTAITVTLPADPVKLLPGYHMLFVFNAAGTPSVAQMVQVTN